MKIACFLHICLSLVLISCAWNTHTRGQPQVNSGNIGQDIKGALGRIGIDVNVNGLNNEGIPYHSSRHPVPTGINLAPTPMAPTNSAITNADNLLQDMPNASLGRQAQLDALNGKIHAMQAQANKIIKSPYASASEYPVLMPTASSNNGWETNPLGTKTKDGQAGSGEIATLQKVAILDVKTWIYNNKINRFIQRNSIGSQFRCNPRNPEGHPKSLFGTACEAALEMRVGGKRYVIPPMFLPEGQPRYAMEIGLQQVEPITDGFLTQADAEKYREDTLSGKITACEATWRTRSDQAKKDGLNPNINQHLVVILNAYASDITCPILAKNSFKKNQQVQQIIAKAPPYVPGRPYDTEKLAELIPVQKNQHHTMKPVVQKNADSSELDDFLMKSLFIFMADAAKNGGHFEYDNNPSINMGEIEIHGEKPQYYQNGNVGIYYNEHY